MRPFCRKGVGYKISCCGGGGGQRVHLVAPMRLRVQSRSRTQLRIAASVLGWPFPPSASASVFYRCFFGKGFFPENRSIKRKCAQLLQFELPHAYALLLHPVSATKLAFENHLEGVQFPRLIFRKKIASHRNGKSHCGNFRTSAPQPPRSVNGQPCLYCVFVSRWFSGVSDTIAPLSPGWAP